MGDCPGLGGKKAQITGPEEAARQCFHYNKKVAGLIPDTGFLFPHWLPSTIQKHAHSTG